jgi:hypothetical protein
VAEQRKGGRGGEGGEQRHCSPGCSTRPTDCRSDSFTTARPPDSQDQCVPILAPPPCQTTPTATLAVVCTDHSRKRHPLPQHTRGGKGGSKETGCALSPCTPSCGFVTRVGVSVVVAKRGWGWAICEQLHCSPEQLPPHTDVCGRTQFSTAAKPC